MPDVNGMLRRELPALWRRRGAWNRLLLPVSWLYAAAMRARRACYRHGLCRVTRFARPVVVVGSIASGGSGKTPVVVYVVRLLLAKGYSPGVVSRGYGACAPPANPLMVGPGTPAVECGDEPAMLAESLRVPVVVDRDRPRGVNALIARGCDVVVSDDGLQHYAMDRRVEIAVLGDGASLGNGWCLPAGPLREPPGRLKHVDMVLRSADAAGAGEHGLRWRLGDFRRVNGSRRRPAIAFHGRRVHAVAGTGQPEGFFAMLADRGLEIERHAFPDHHRYTFEDFQPMADAPIVMTEKDAVKCRKLPLGDAWFAPLAVRLDETFDTQLLALLRR